MFGQSAYVHQYEKFGLQGQQISDYLYQLENVLRQYEGLK
jgi:hypothetical protein